MARSTKTKKRSKEPTRARVIVATKTGNKVGVSDWSAVAVTYQHELVCCGQPRCGRCKGKHAAHGPYWYGYFRTWSGRKKSIYIGKDFRPLTNSQIDEAH